MLKDLAAYRTFVAIVEQSSLTAAAEALGRSVQAVSRDLMRLESDLGSPLVLRTTRRRQLTTAGKEFYRRIAATLAELDRAEEDFRARTLRVAGPIKITGPTLFGPRVVTPIITDFLARYTEVSIALDLTDSFVDPAASGADFTIRIGDTPPSSRIARRLGEVRRVAVASPAYLEARGRPQRPSELSGHDCVVRRGDKEAARWTFVSDEGETNVEVKGRFETNSVPAAIEAVVRGQGIVVAAFWQVREILEAGSLEIVLPDAQLRSRPVAALWSPPRRLPTRARLFIEFLASRLSTQLL